MEGLLAPWHILIVLVVALLVLGPSKLPEVGRQVGRGVAELRKFRAALEDDVRGFLGQDEHEPPTSSGGELPPADAGGKPPLPEGGD